MFGGFINLIRNILLSLFILVFFQSTLSAARTLVYSDHEPLEGMRTQLIKDIFFTALEEESGGRLRIEDHWNGELAKSYDALRAVGKDGIADIAIVVPEYAPIELPLHQMFKSFPVGPTGQKQVDFFRQVNKEIPEFRKELEKENVVAILFTTGFPVAFFSAEQMESLEEIKGTKWRTASFWHQDFLRNSGATPISMPWGDGVTKALQDGSLHGLMVNLDSGYDIKAHEIAPNILVSKDLWLGHVYILVMNKEVWNGLSIEDQEAVYRAAESTYQVMGQSMESGFDIEMNKLQNEGARIRILSAQEVKKWEFASGYQEAQATWISEQQDKGIENVADILERVNIIRNEAMR